MKRLISFLLTALLCFGVNAYAENEKPCLDVTLGYAVLSESVLTSAMGLCLGVHGAKLRDKAI